MNGRFVPLAGICVLLGLAGCSDDDAANSATSALLTVASIPPTASSPTTSASVATAPPTSVSTTTSPTTTTGASPTTADLAAVTKAAVAAAIVQSRQDYLYAVGNYDAPDALDVLRRTWSEGGPSWNLVLTTMQSMQTNGYRLRPHPSITDASTVEGEVKLLDGLPGTRAEVQVCTVSSGVVFKPAGAPDGGDLTINDAVVARRTLVTVVFQDGAWKAYEGTILGSWDGEASCPAA